MKKLVLILTFSLLFVTVARAEFISSYDGTQAVNTKYIVYIGIKDGEEKLSSGNKMYFYYVYAQMQDGTTAILEKVVDDDVAKDLFYKLFKNLNSKETK
jgi:hypothetical protein